MIQSILQDTDNDIKEQLTLELTKQSNTPLLFTFIMSCSYFIQRNFQAIPV